MAVSTVKLNGTTLMTVNDTTSTTSDVSAGTYFYGADGVKREGEASGGGDPLNGWNDQTTITGAVTITGTSIRANILGGNTNVTSVSAPDATSLASGFNQFGSHFRGCTNLVSVSMPKLDYSTNISSVFQGCTSLTSVNLPLMRAMYGNYIFSGCSSLPGAVFPNYGYNVNNANAQISSFFFENCTSLAYVDMLRPYQIAANAFKNVSAFNVFIIRDESRVTPLNNINAFDGTPFASDGAGGILYVPNAILASYEAASNWSTILGYTNNQIKKIEGTTYETHYADGTSIPT